MSAASVWAATAAPAPETGPLRESRRAEVAVVGGGFTGLSAALHLAARGVETVVLEAAEPGWGASGRNGGQVIATLKCDLDELERRFGREEGGRLVETIGSSADDVFALIAEHGIACHAARHGWIQGAHSAGAVALVHRRAEQWMARGAPVWRS
jgi:glycine/D-amino acid oxidase-like deaminating enzyme